LVFAIASLPLWDAGRSEAAWVLNAVVFATLVLAREAVSLRSTAAQGIPVRRFLVPGCLFFAAALWSLVQSLPTGGGIGHPVWAMAGDVLGMDIPARFSLDPDATRLATMRLVTLACAFWVAAHLSADPRRAVLILGSVVAVTMIASMYALSMAAMAPPPLPGQQPSPTADRMAGTFGNRNAFATFAGVGLVVALSLLGRRIKGAINGAGAAPDMGCAVLRAITGAGSLYFFAVVVIAVALVATGSRGGILATALGVAVLPFLMMGWGRRRDVARGAAILLILLAGLAALLTAFGDTVVGRLSRIGLDDNGRLDVAATTLVAIKASPWAGYGFGTFTEVFPMFRDDPATIWNAWTSAHNLYLETVLELGLPFAFLLFLSVGSIWWTCLRGAITRRRLKAVPAAAACAGIVAFVHAAADFSLSVQAVGIILAIVLGAGFAQAFRSAAYASRSTVARGASVGLTSRVAALDDFR
jgi:O-antigen ligase